MNNTKKLVEVLKKEDLGMVYDYLKNGNGNLNGINYKELKEELKKSFLEFAYGAMFYPAFKDQNGGYHQTNNRITTKIILFLEENDLDNFNEEFDNILSNLNPKYNIDLMLEEAHTLYEDAKKERALPYANYIEILNKIDELLKGIEINETNNVEISKDPAIALLEINNPELMEMINNNKTLLNDKEWLDNNVNEHVALCVTSLVTNKSVESILEESKTVLEDTKDEEEPILPNEDKTEMIPIITDDMLNNYDLNHQEENTTIEDPTVGPLPTDYVDKVNEQILSQKAEEPNPFIMPEKEPEEPITFVNLPEKEEMVEEPNTFIMTGEEVPVEEPIIEASAITTEDLKNVEVPVEEAPAVEPTKETTPVIPTNNDAVNEIIENIHYDDLLNTLKQKAQTTAPITTDENIANLFDENIPDSYEDIMSQININNDDLHLGR